MGEPYPATNQASAPLPASLEDDLLLAALPLGHQRWRGPRAGGWEVSYGRYRPLLGKLVGDPRGLRLEGFDHIQDGVMLGRELFDLCRRQVECRNALASVAEDGSAHTRDELRAEALLAVLLQLEIVVDHVDHIWPLHVPEQQLLVDPARADECRVEDLGMVGRHHHDALRRVNDAIKHIEQPRKVELVPFECVCRTVHRAWPHQPAGATAPARACACACAAARGHAQHGCHHHLHVHAAVLLLVSSSSAVGQGAAIVAEGTNLLWLDAHLLGWRHTQQLVLQRRIHDCAGLERLAEATRKRFGKSIRRLLALALLAHRVLHLVRQDRCALCRRLFLHVVALLLGARARCLGHAQPGSGGHKTCGCDGGGLEPLRLAHQVIDQLLDAFIVTIVSEQQIPRCRADRSDELRLLIRQECIVPLHASNRADFAIAPLDDLGGGVDILHHEDNILEAELDRHVIAHHHVGLVEHDVHELLVGGDPRERDVDNGSSRVLRERLDQGRLACARWAVEQQPQLVRIALHGILARLSCKVPNLSEQLLLLVEEERVERLVVGELVPLEDARGGLLAVLAGPRADLHLVEVAAVVLHLLELQDVPPVALVDELVDRVLVPGAELERGGDRRLLRLLALVALMLDHPHLDQLGGARLRHGRPTVLGRLL
mmetsp:Transcript_40908/g.119454  ORF Transcript_40908/g.119454 Transcript_40908/m.119454 type:complete len:659 (-) Transcript_40908:133-2109(-)